MKVRCSRWKQCNLTISCRHYRVHQLKSTCKKDGHCNNGNILTLPKCIDWESKSLEGRDYSQIVKKLKTACRGIAKDMNLNFDFTSSSRNDLSADLTIQFKVKNPVKVVNKLNEGNKDKNSRYILV